MIFVFITLYLSIRMMLSNEPMNNSDDVLRALFNVIKSPVSIIFFAVIIIIALFSFFITQDDILPKPDDKSGKFGYGVIGLLYFLYGGVGGTAAVLGLSQGNKGIIVYGTCLIIGIIILAIISFSKASSNGDEVIAGIGYFFCYEVYCFLRGLVVVLYLVGYATLLIPLVLIIADEASDR